MWSDPHQVTVIDKHNLTQKQQILTAHAGKACELNVEICWQQQPLPNVGWILDHSSLQIPFNISGLSQLHNTLQVMPQHLFNWLFQNINLLLFKPLFCWFGSSCCCITQPLLSLKSCTALGPFAPAGCKNKLGVSPALGLVTSRLTINIYTCYNI